MATEKRSTFQFIVGLICLTAIGCISTITYLRFVDKTCQPPTQQASTQKMPTQQMLTQQAAYIAIPGSYPGSLMDVQESAFDDRLHANGWGTLDSSNALKGDSQELIERANKIEKESPVRAAADLLCASGAQLKLYNLSRAKALIERSQKLIDKAPIAERRGFARGLIQLGKVLNNEPTYMGETFEARKYVLETAKQRLDSWQQTENTDYAILLRELSAVYSNIAYHSGLKELKKQSAQLKERSAQIIYRIQSARSVSIRQLSRRPDNAEETARAQTALALARKAKSTDPKEREQGLLEQIALAQSSKSNDAFEKVVALNTELCKFYLDKNEPQKAKAVADVIIRTSQLEAEHWYEIVPAGRAMLWLSAAFKSKNIPLYSKKLCQSAAELALSCPTMDTALEQMEIIDGCARWYRANGEAKEGMKLYQKFADLVKKKATSPGVTWTAQEQQERFLRESGRTLEAEQVHKSVELARAKENEAEKLTEKDKNPFAGVNKQAEAAEAQVMISNLAGANKIANDILRRYKSKLSEHDRAATYAMWKIARTMSRLGHTSDSDKLKKEILMATEIKLAKIAPDRSAYFADELDPGVNDSLMKEFRQELINWTLV